MREARRGRRIVRLSSEDRVLFPGSGITKGHLWDYYAAVAPAILPHLRDRPFTMKRWRGGIRGGSFFQKQAPKGIPDWIPTRQFRTQPREGGARLVDFPLVQDELALLWMVQMHCIDMNAWYSRVDKPSRPDFVLFDLDPPESRRGFEQAVEVAHLVRGALAEVGLEGWAKTSGAGGLHVLVPIERRATFGQAHEFTERLTKLLAARHPGLVTAEWLKAKRRGVFVDYHQNGAGKTIASAYSVRPKPGAPVSTPLRWDELVAGLDYRDLTMSVVEERVERHGDLFEPVLHGVQRLAPALAALRKSTAAPPKRGRRARA
ncbi:MAG: non-homologous end-joining DNA ligase [Gaiellaceae bacterium]